MYRAYAPDKLENTNAVMEKYQGAEEALIEALVKKYGPEPTADAPSASPAARRASVLSSPGQGPAASPRPAAGDYRSRIVALYETYAPGKLGTVDAALEKYQGAEDALIEALVKKYGPEPSSGSSGPSAAAAASPAAAAPSSPSAGPASPGRKGDYRSRIVALYEAYAPSKLGSVDAALEKYQGAEDALIEALVKKYGPEPAAGAASPAGPSSPSGGADAAASPTAAKGDYRGRIVAIYEKYAPEKLGSVDAALEKYKGSEDALIDALVKKYGPEPGVTYAGQASPRSPTVASSPPLGDYKSRIVALYEKYAPEKVGTVDGALEKYRGSEDALIDALVKKYGPEPAVGAASPSGPPRSAEVGASSPASPAASPTAAKGHYRGRIVAIYEKYAPEKLGSVDAALEKYKGSEDALIDALVKKYGPEPGVSSAPTASSTSTPVSTNDYRGRLIALYEKYAPAKVGSVDGALEKYRGSEDALIDALVKKYGPEPTPTTVSAPSPAAATQPAANAELVDRIRAMYICYQPEKQDQVPKLLEKYRGEEMQLLKSLVQRHGPEPMGAGNADVAALEREVANTRRAAEVEWEEPCASKFLEWSILLSREAKRQWDARSHEANLEGTQRVAIEAEWQGGNKELESKIPRCPLLANRAQAKSFFECLGTMNAGAVATIDEGTFLLLLDCVGVGSEYLPQSIKFPMPFEQFFSVLIQSCHDSELLLQRMNEFVHVAASGQAARRSESAAVTAGTGNTAATPRPSVVRRTVDVGSGFWAHKCVFPSVLEHWSRVWVVYNDESKKLTWSTANSTKVQGSIPVTHMLRVRLSAMISAKAPKKFAKNGISVQLTEGANPLLVALCPESIDYTHELLQVLRKAKQRQERSAIEARRSDNARAPPAPTPRLTFVPIWCCRSGFDQFARTLWSVAGDRVLHKAHDEDRESYWLLEDVTDVSAAPLQGLNAPTKFKSFGFTVKFRGGALFCCAESPSARDDIVDSLKKGIFRQYIANHARSTSPKRKDDASVLRSSSATPGTSPAPKLGTTPRR